MRFIKYTDIGQTVQSKQATGILLRLELINNIWCGHIYNMLTRKMTVVPAQEIKTKVAEGSAIPATNLGVLNKVQLDVKEDEF